MTDTATPGSGPPTCPVSRPFDPLHDPYLTDPTPYFDEYLRSRPVFFDPALNYWVISRHADVKRVLREYSSFTAAITLNPLEPPCPAAVEVLNEGGFRPVPTMTNTDPPQHTRTRRIANLGFTARRVAALEGFIRDLVTGYIDRLEDIPERRADLYRALNYELPARVVFRILGVPDEDIAEVKKGSESRLLFTFGRSSEAEQIDIAAGNARFWRYTEQLAEDRRANPRDDFTSDLVHATDDDGLPLSQQEVSTILFGLLLAGHETTTNLLTSSVRRLLEFGLWPSLVDDPGLVPAAVEETLRFDSPVIGWRRRTTEPVELSGVGIPADADLLVLIGAANRDPEVFDDPGRFDIHRSNARDNLSFGSGPHHCIGAPLARLEARVALEELTRRLPGLELDGDPRYTYLPNIAFRGPQQLPVRW